MGNFDFSVLYDQYPEVISQMPPVFDSHQFILKLAQQNQAAYVEALYAYRYEIDGDSSSPFRTVHQILSKHLKEFPELVELVRYDKTSTDIFGNSRPCAEWRKVN